MNFCSRRSAFFAVQQIVGDDPVVDLDPGGECVGQHAGIGAHDPDPQVRRRLVDSITSLDDISWASWLWELANDDDQGVRRAALDVLATSSNPETRRRVTQRRGE